MTTIAFLDRLPKLRIRVEPTTTVKLKKRLAWRQYKFWLAADYHVQDNLWRFQTSLAAGDNNDAGLLGGGAVLVLAGRELQYHRSWDVQLLPDLYTCLRLRTAVDVLNGQASVKIGFGSNVIRAVDLQKGLTVRHQFPLDQAQPPTTTMMMMMGSNNNNKRRESNVKLEVAASLALPDTALEFSTPGFRRSHNNNNAGGGGGAVTTATVSDIRVALDEVNLVLDY
jgi:hypothetical protein